VPKVPRLWPGETIVCVASGPSLIAADIARVRGKARVVVINTSYKMAPWADVLYACDAKWWKWHKGAPDFGGLKFGMEKLCARWPDVMVLKNTGTEGLEVQPHGLRTGGNSGYQAINLAVHLGAARIVLLGYDLQRTGGREHWHPDHPTKTRSPYTQFVKRFSSLVAPLAELGIEVVNCTRQTALACFPRRALEEVFPDESVGRVLAMEDGSGLSLGVQSGGSACAASDGAASL
jgi:hypothetical protein